MARYSLPATLVAAFIALTSCVDDKYDLSDVDTTAKISVENLTLPVNIDPITLKSIINLDTENPDAALKEIDGVYAVLKGGTFSSSNISIEAVTLKGMAGDPIRSIIATGAGGQTLPPGMSVSIPVSTDEIDFAYSSDAVPREILEIDNISGPFAISLSIDFGTLGSISRFEIRNAVFKMPKGLRGEASHGAYNPSTGEISIPSYNVTDGRMIVTLDCTGLDYAASGAVYDAATGSARLTGEVGLLSGDMIVDGADVTGLLPAEISTITSFTISDIYVEKFSGTIRYDITGVDISDVSLDDLPDIFTQDGTAIKIVNPQIYLNIVNPLAPYGLEATTGMSITGYFDGEPPFYGKPCLLDAPGYFTVSSAASSDYLLSPKPASPYPGYNNPLHVPYTSLSTVLFGDGLPKSLTIDLVDPQVFPQTVVDLPLGRQLGVVEGRYDFLAPLAFEEGSHVIYTDIEDGWNDDDVDAITIEELVLTTTVSSDLPFSLDFTGHPIDIDGNQINGVNIEGANIPANAREVDVTIRVTGKVTHLDGIVFTATGRVPADMTQPLSPAQHIDCKNIRAKVSGYYIKEL